MIELEEAAAPAAAPEVALWRAVVLQALADKDAQWFNGGPDFRCVCAYADIEPSYLAEKAPELLTQARRVSRPASPARSSAMRGPQEAAIP